MKPESTDSNDVAKDNIPGFTSCRSQHIIIIIIAPIYITLSKLKIN